MKFSEADPADAQLVHSYDEQTVSIQLGQSAELKALTKPFLLTAEQLVEQPKIAQIADLALDDVDYFQSLNLEIVILGQATTKRVPSKTLVAFSQKAMGVEQMQIGPACRTYNLLVSEGRRVGLVVNFPSDI